MALQFRTTPATTHLRQLPRLSKRPSRPLSFQLPLDQPPLLVARRSLMPPRRRLSRPFAAQQGLILSVLYISFLGTHMHPLCQRIIHMWDSSISLFRIALCRNFIHNPM